MITKEIGAMNRLWLGNITSYKMVLLSSVPTHLIGVSLDHNAQNIEKGRKRVCQSLASPCKETVSVSCFYKVCLKISTGFDRSKHRLPALGSSRHYNISPSIDILSPVIEHFSKQGADRSKLQ